MYLDRLNCANPLKSTAINSATLQSTSLNSDALRANLSIFTQSTHIFHMLPMWCSIYNEWKWLHAEQNYTREWDWSAKYSSLSRHHLKKRKKVASVLNLSFYCVLYKTPPAIIQICYSSVQLFRYAIILLSHKYKHMCTHTNTLSWKLSTNVPFWHWIWTESHSSRHKQHGWNYWK